MSVLNITGVNPTTDQLTIASHGLATGAGPAAVYALSGSTMPGGLAGATDYWIIVDDANTIRLAISSTNALNGTAIDITSAGSGALQLLLGMPYRRATTYAAKSQVLSADLDAIQDNLVALWNLFTAQAQSIYSGIMLASGQHVVLSGTGAYKRGTKVRKLPTQLGSFSASNGWGSNTWTPAANANEGAIPLVVQEGERITEVKAKVSCGATDTFTLKVFRYDPATQLSTQLGATATSAGHAGATEDLVVSGLAEACSSADGYNYTALITVSAFGAGTLALHGVELTTDVP